ncbi:MAG: murein biosynthesis integral membrane protein MurJ [Phycisphaerae bacterium]|nr:murein biosynthesis integral membrane protein MurJ [Phycisphaerae bacterium]
MAAERFEKNARTFTLLTLVSRVTGLARDATLSRAFGVGPVMDAFSFGFMIPNLFRRLFGEGALTASFLPIYARTQRADPASARRYASLMLVLMAIVLNAIVLVGELILFGVHSATAESELIIGTPIVVAGTVMMPVGERLPQLGIELLMVMLPYMPLVCMVAVIGAILQTHDRFGPTAASPLILNLMIVGTALGLMPLFHSANTAVQGTHATLVGASVIVAGIMQLAWSLWAARHAGLSLRAAREALRDRTDAAWSLIQETLGKALPMMLGLGVLQLNTFLDGLIASWPTIVGPTIFGRPFPLGEGAMAALGNAQRLYEFPLGVFGLAVANAIFPVLARQSNDNAAFLTTLRRGLRMTMFIGLPASIGLFLIARPAVAVVLEGGRFTIDDTHRVAFILLGYAPAIWSYSMVNVLIRAFYASGDSVTPTRVSVLMVGLNLVGNLTLIWTPLREAGLAWSTAICSVIQCAVLLVILRQRVGAIIDRDLLMSWLRTALATSVMAAAVIGAAMWVPHVHAGWWGAVRELAILIPVGAVAVLGTALLLRMPEMRWALGRR